MVEMAAADQAISFLIGQMDKTATEVCSSSEGSPDSEQTELAFHTDLSAHLIRVEGELGRSCLQRVCTLRYGCRAQYGRVLVLLVQRWSRQWLRQVCDLAALIGCLARPAAYAHGHRTEHSSLVAFSLFSAFLDQNMAICFDLCMIQSRSDCDSGGSQPPMTNLCISWNGTCTHDDVRQARCNETFLEVRLANTTASSWRDCDPRLRRGAPAYQPFPDRLEEHTCALRHRRVCKVQRLAKI